MSAPISRSTTPPSGSRPTAWAASPRAPVGGLRTRRYHALLLAATTPPTGRMVLVNGFDAWVETDADGQPVRASISAGSATRPDVVHPDGARRIESFAAEPWPTLDAIACADGTPDRAGALRARAARRVVALRWRLLGRAGAGRRWRCGRSSRAATTTRCTTRTRPSASTPSVAAERRRVAAVRRACPAIAALANGELRARAALVPQLPLRRGARARARLRRGPGLAGRASPGTSRAGEAVLMLAAAGRAGRRRVEPRPRRRPAAPRRARRAAARLRARRCTAPPTPTSCARGAGKTIVAGYPVVHRLGPRHVHRAARPLPRDRPARRRARRSCSSGPGSVSEGMLPNRFPDQGDAPEYNSVDASLWYVVAVHDYLRAREAEGRQALPRGDRSALDDAVAGDPRRATPRHALRHPRATTTACSRRGEPGVQLTWMDAKVGDWVVTPRIGKPVEIQALWLNALRIAERARDRLPADLRARRAPRSPRGSGTRPRAASTTSSTSTTSPGAADATLRPNQILAVGGLPFPLLDGRARAAGRRRRRARGSGRRSACARSPPGEPGYRPRYEGDVRARDGAYHQGTVWPWLLGPFVEAWVRVRGGTPEAEREARRRFLDPAARAPRPRPGSATSPRSPTATRRTRRAAAPSRPGRSARRCASTSRCSRAVSAWARRRSSGALVSAASTASVPRPAPAAPLAGRRRATGRSTPSRPRCSASSCCRPASSPCCCSIPASPVPGLVPDPFLRRAAHGAGHGRHGRRAHLLGVGQAVGSALQPGRHAHLLPAGQGRAAGRGGVRGGAVRRRGGRGAGGALLVAGRWWRTPRCTTRSRVPGRGRRGRGVRGRGCDLLRPHDRRACGCRTIRGWAGSPALCAGLLVATFITLEAPLSGMSMNPARTVGSGSLGPRLDRALDLLRRPAAGHAGRRASFTSGAAASLASSAPSCTTRTPKRCIFCEYRMAQGTSRGPAAL